jgi:predicted DNA-binding protein with PD1-like motif
VKISLTPGRKIMGRLPKGEDLLAALSKVVREHGIILGEVRAIGAVSQAGWAITTRRSANIIGSTWSAL